MGSFIADIAEQARWRHSSDTYIRAARHGQGQDDAAWCRLGTRETDLPVTLLTSQADL